LRRQPDSSVPHHPGLLARDWARVEVRVARGGQIPMSPMMMERACGTSDSIWQIPINPMMMERACGTVKVCVSSARLPACTSRNMQKEATATW